MKKLFIVALFAVSVAACEGNSKDTQSEEIPATTAGAIVNAVEALSKEDTTQYACTCEHKCKTKEECVKNCGEGCQMVK